MEETFDKLSGTEEILETHEMRLINTPIYRSLAGKYRALYKVILEGLPAELRAALLEYDDLYGDMLIYQEDYFYEEGFKDAIVLMSRQYMRADENCEVKADTGE